jgi:hypothetical protein
MTAIPILPRITNPVDSIVSNNGYRSERGDSRHANQAERVCVSTGFRFVEHRLSSISN